MPMREGENLKLSSIKIGMSNLTSTGTDVACVVDAGISYKKDSDGKRTNEAECFLFTVLSHHGETFVVRIPYKAKLNTTFSDIKNRIELMGSVRIVFLTPSVKLYAFTNDNNRLVSGVKVEADEFSVEEDASDSEISL